MQCSRSSPVGRMILEREVAGSHGGFEPVCRGRWLPQLLREGSCLLINHFFSPNPFCFAMNTQNAAALSRFSLLHVLMLLGVIGLFATGCTDEGGGSLVGSNGEDVDRVEQATAKSTTTESCEIIDFNTYEHGDPISTASVFGTSLDITAERYPPKSATGISPRAFDTDLSVDQVSDTDYDLVYQGDGAICDACEGLGRVLVIPDPDFTAKGDYRHGGEVTLSGFSGSDLYLKSFIVVDDDATEPPVRAFVDGTKIGESSALGNGTVETVSLGDAVTIDNTLRFVLGTEEQEGSGALDDLEICRQEEVGEEGCTLGYWKNHTGQGPGNQANAWAATGYETDDQLDDVFDIPGTLEFDGDETLLDALSFSGGSDATAAARLLLKQAVAALLNASHPDVSYGMTTDQIISDVNDALATEDRETMLALKDKLDELNNASCPL